MRIYDSIEKKEPVAKFSVGQRKQAQLYLAVSDLCQLPNTKITMGCPSNLYI